MEWQGLRVNMMKAKMMVFWTELDVLQGSNTYPYAVSWSGLGDNST